MGNNIPIDGPILAKRLAEVLGSTPEFWLTRERNYRADLARLAAKGER